MTHPGPNLPSPRPTVLNVAPTGRAVERRGRWRRGRISLGPIVACLLGMALIFNPYVVPSEAEGSPRASDLISVLLGIVLLIRWITGYRYALRFPVALWVVFGLVLFWFTREWIASGTLSSTDPFRWLLALPYAYALYRFASRPATRAPLVIGLCVGTAANIAVLALQAAGLNELTVHLGLASGRWSSVWISGPHEALRPTGMWGHPNASAGVIALCFPLVCGLIDERRLAPWWIVFAWLVVFASSVLTYTRSGVVISALAFVLWIGRSLASGRYLRWKLSLSLVIIVALGIIGPPGGWWRWLGESEIALNSAGRLDSTFRGMQLALLHPLGIGANYQEQLAAITTSGIQATHNSWLYLALVGGLPLALYLFLRVICRMMLLLRKSTIEGWLAFGIMGLFFFEEFFRVPCFVVLTLWLAIKPQPSHDLVLDQSKQHRTGGQPVAAPDAT